MDDQAPRDPWAFAASAADLAAKGRMVLRIGRKQLALFATPDGPRAVDNRCPHEGYPLSEGSLDAACRLTCNWHNWKFDLATGANLTGGDALRVYPVERRGEDLWVKIEEPPAERRQAEALRRLDEALEDRAYDRTARELARFLAAGGAPEAALTDAIVRRHDRLEFGFGHAFAAAPDWLALRAGLTDEAERLIPLTEILDHIGEDTRREDRWPYSDEQAPWDTAAFRAAIEAENEAAAIARLNGALAAGLGFADLEPAFTAAALAHYADFGHSLIYVVACGRLIRALGPGSAPPLLRALTRSLVKQTREDLIPEFRAYAPALARFTAAPGAALDEAALDKADTRRALGAVAEAGGGGPEALFIPLLRANARNLRDFDQGFDQRWDRPVQDNAGWLDVTHGLTFAAAVWQQCQRFPALWPEGLLQMACFAGRNRRFRTKAPEPVVVPEELLAQERAALLDHGIDAPILAAHRLKTLMAVETLARDLPAEAPLLTAALARYLAGGVKGKHLRRSVRQALEIVARE